jgi:molecular chaperone GrpE
MTENEIVPDSGPEAENGEDVEIVEVVGMDQEPDPFGTASGIAEERAREVDEYVLDLDDPDGGILADPPQMDARSAEAGSESDRTRLVRLRADYDNLRKRIDREREEFELHANVALVSRLLPVLDNLDRALGADASDDSSPALREGLVMICKQLRDELAEEGLQPIDAMDQVFDPNLHDAVAMASDADAPANMVVEEFQRGYLFRNRVLRHALVKVTTGGEEGEGESGDSEEDC